MAIIREEHQQDYTVIHNKVLDDPNISLECKGVYALISMIYKDDGIEIEELYNEVIFKGSRSLYSDCDIEFMLYDLQKRGYIKIKTKIDYGLKKTFNYIEIL